MAQFLGIVDIVWDNAKIPIEKGAKLRIGGMKNNPVVLARTVGRAQEFQPSEITASTVLPRGKRFSDLYKTGEGELQVHCDTGQVFVWNDAFLSGDRPEMTGGEGGKIELKWTGGEPEEILNG